jgi:pilus assembly protein Flp/PilA
MERLRILADPNGQDLTDYALIAGFLVLAAGAVSPLVAERIAQVYGKVLHAITTSQGSSAK